MCTKTLSCILCGQPNFTSVDALRVSLLKVTARPLKCPICGDEVLGLDKLTIHLFGHSLLEDQQTAPTTEQYSKNDTKRNTTSNAGDPLKTLRKVRRKETFSEEIETGSNDKWPTILPPVTNSQCSSNVHHCHQCDVEFRNPALLKMHREVFHDNSLPSTASNEDQRFVCHICPKEFKMKGSLKIHMRVVHAGSSKRLCLEGAKRGSSIQADDAALSTSSSNNSTAMLARSNDVIPPIMSMPLLERNIAIFQPQLSTIDGNGAHPESHIIQIIDPRQLAQVVYLSPKTNSEASCVDNGSIAAAQQLTHESLVSQQKVETISLPCSPQQQLQHDNPKQWECEVCKKSFTTKYFLKKHNRLHTGEMPYACGICGKSFTFQQSYHKHLLYHSDEKPHVCAVCNRAFKELSTLHNHERIHSGEKPFACETCGKCFRQRVSYLVHRRIHTGLLPYKCSGCEKSFRYKVSQRTHKCPASPPGTVVRKTGDLLQKLLQSSSILPEGTSQQDNKRTLFVASPTTVGQTEVGQMAEEDKQTADYVNRTLDELVQGTYDKLDIRDNSSASPLYNHQPQQLYSESALQATLQQQISPPLPNETNFPRIENLCLLSPIAFDSGQLEDLEGLKLDSGW